MPRSMRASADAGRQMSYSPASARKSQRGSRLARGSAPRAVLPLSFDVGRRERSLGLLLRIRTIRLRLFAGLVPVTLQFEIGPRCGAVCAGVECVVRPGHPLARCRVRSPIGLLAPTGQGDEQTVRALKRRRSPVAG